MEDDVAWLQMSDVAGVTAAVATAFMYKSKGLGEFLRPSRNDERARWTKKMPI